MLLFSSFLVVYTCMEADCIVFGRSRAAVFVDTGAVEGLVNKADVELLCYDYGAYEHTCQYLLRLPHSERVRKWIEGM